MILIAPQKNWVTNPASAAMVGFECKIVQTTSEGLMDIQAMEQLLDEHVAALRDGDGPRARTDDRVGEGVLRDGLPVHEHDGR